MMRGIVGVVASEHGRTNHFWADLNKLLAPDGVDIVPVVGGTLGGGRQALCEHFLTTDAAWLAMIDDDHRFAPDWLLRLLARPTVPILGSLYLDQSPPFLPRVYHAPDEHLQFAGVSLTELPTTGVHPVYAVGSSGLLIQRHVFEQLPSPWFTLGQFDHYGEDLAFCHHAQQADIPVHVDVEAILGHVSMMTIWPSVQQGTWVTSIQRHWLAISIAAAERPADMVIA
jgi:hypothetical protein